MTNEDRFIASCENLGEADVRAKLSAGRYSECKASWATAWLKRMDSCKNDITEADESRIRMRNTGETQNLSVAGKLAFVIVVLLAGLTGLFLL